MREPWGIFYTAVTGIWQTVWLEEVPEVSVERLVVTPDLDQKSVWVQVVVGARRRYRSRSRTLRRWWYWGMELRVGVSRSRWGR